LTAENPTRPRRSDRALEDDRAIESLLHRLPVGFVALTDGDQPYINSNLFWFDAAARRIYFHTAAVGRTRGIVERNPRVCFSTAEIGRLLPADTALEFSTEYASVVVFGRARIVEGEDEQRHGLQGLLDKYFPDLRPGVHYRPIIEEELRRTSVYAVEIDTWSGKQKPTPEPSADPDPR
jgi:nitroimidazol reductase NimA-like FMN-containing flavoprotein (pyridoxamine 5'-phosphate oxidase superfamily)